MTKRTEQGWHIVGSPYEVLGRQMAKVNIDGDIKAFPLETALLIVAAQDLLRFARAIEQSAQDALRPGSPDTFMSLVKRIQDYRAWARAAIAKTEVK